MPRYRKIDPRIWNDEKFSSLSHEAQRMFFFVLTHPSMTALGAFRISKSGMADELGLDTKGFAQPFAELLEKGLVKYDERAFLLFAPNFLKYNPPENPNVIKGWVGSIDLLPECPLLLSVLERAKTSASSTDAGSKAFENTLGRVVETLSKLFAKPSPKSMANQEQEQEQEQEIKEKEKKEKPARETAGALATKLQKPEGISDDLWKEWVAHKKKRCRGCTQRMVDAIVREASAAGISTQAAMEIQLENGWSGFKAEYVLNKGWNGAKDSIPFAERDYSEGINDDNTF
ncbi:MAG: hypothetical protein Q3X95_03325 [Duodenibacillus sp.]|nr:hypothetical protein [Duodenibacillus sp.]